MWTRFMDMHSGGKTKENFDYCYIEAPESEAIEYFRTRFGHSPDDVACDCCGENYSVSEDATLQQATGFERNCEYDRQLGYIEQTPKQNLEIREACNTPDSDRWGLHIPLDEYLKRKYILVIYAKDIKG